MLDSVSVLRFNSSFVFFSVSFRLGMFTSVLGFVFLFSDSDSVVAVVGRSLYIIDGFKFHCVNGPTRLSALCLDEVQNQKSSLSFSMYPQWKTKRPCTVSRTCASLVELNGLLYYIGGLREDEDSCNTVECD